MICESYLFALCATKFRLRRLRTIQLLIVASQSGPNLAFSHRCRAIGRLHCRTAGWGSKGTQRPYFSQAKSSQSITSGSPPSRRLHEADASLSLLTTCTASRFSSRYCPVLPSSVAPRLSSMVFTVSLVRNLLEFELDLADSIIIWN